MPPRGFMGSNAPLGMGCHSSKQQCSGAKQQHPLLLRLACPEAQRAAPDRPQSHLTEQSGSFSCGFHAGLLQHGGGGPADNYPCADGPRMHSERHPKQTVQTLQIHSSIILGREQRKAGCG